MSVTPESVQQLLNSEDLGDRLRGVNELRQLERSRAFELVQPVLQDRNPRVRYAAVSQMDTLGRENPLMTLELLRERLQNESEADVLAVVADALCALQLAEAYEELVHLYRQKSHEWLIQMSIIAALGELGDRRAFELLVEALDTENTLLKAVAIGSLGELGDPRAISVLAPYTSDTEWQIRQRLVQALSRLGTAEARPLLIQLSTDEVELVANEAQEALQQF